MNRLIPVAFTLIIGLAFTRCNQNNDLLKVPESALKTSLIDSIKKLDSIAFKTRLTNRNLSRSSAKQAFELASELKLTEGYIIAYSAKANSNFPTDYDSAFINLTKALNLSDSAGISEYKPGLLSNLAILYNLANNAQIAIMLLDSSITLATRLKKYSVISLSYNELGNIHFNIMDSGNAKKFYDSAYIIAKRHFLDRETGFALGNMAKLEKDQEKNREIAKKAMFYLKKCETVSEGLADVLISIGYTFSDPDSALFYYSEALKIAEKGKLPLEEIGAFNNLAYCYLENGRIQDAESCLIGHAIPIALGIDNPDWLATLYDSYADVLLKEGHAEKAVAFEKKSIEMKTEADRRLAASHVRLLSGMLDLKNKESLIRIKDLEIGKHQNRERVMFLWFIISGFCFIILLILFLVYRLRRKLEFQKQKTESARRIIEIEEHEKRKLSMELHDLSGQVHMDLMEHFRKINIPEGDAKTEMIRKINGLSDYIRGISHRMSRITIEKHDIATLLTGLCAEFEKFSGLKIRLSIPADPPDMTAEAKLHIFRILQEMLANAIKYAQGSEIIINILFRANEFELEYSDNGPGFDPGVVKNKGLGILNIEERARLLNGKSEVDSKPGLGVYWKIEVPL